MVLFTKKIRASVIYPTNEIFSDRPLYTPCKPSLRAFAYVRETLMITPEYTFDISSYIQIAKYEPSRKISL